jgi:hypothetical protein
MKSIFLKRVNLLEGHTLVEVLTLYRRRKINLSLITAVEAHKVSHISWLTDGGEGSLKLRASFSPRKIFGTYFC